MGFIFQCQALLHFRKVPSREIFSMVPLDKILVETDSPYLAPPPYRGKRNEPAYVVHTARIGAEIFEISYEEFALQTESNLSLIHI